MTPSPKVTGNETRGRRSALSDAGCVFAFNQ